MTKIEITVNGVEVALNVKGKMYDFVFAAGVLAANAAKEIAKKSGNTEMSELHRVFEIAMEALEKDLKK